MKSLYFFHTLRVIGFAFLSMIAIVILGTAVRFTDIEGVALHVIYVLIGFVSNLLFLFFSFRKSGYDYNRNNDSLIDKENIITMVLAWLTYVVLTVVLKYNFLGAAEGVSYLAGIMVGDISLGLKTLANEYSGVMFLSLMIYTIPYIPAMMLGHMSGAKKRRRVVETIISEQK